MDAQTVKIMIFDNLTRFTQFCVYCKITVLVVYVFCVHFIQGADCRLYVWRESTG